MSPAVPRIDRILTLDPRRGFISGRIVYNFRCGRKIHPARRTIAAGPTQAISPSATACLPLLDCGFRTFDCSLQKPFIISLIVPPSLAKSAASFRQRRRVSRRDGEGQFSFFWEQSNPETGLVKDRCNVRAPDNRLLGSIAATGFGLTASCIGERPRLHLLCPSAGSRPGHAALSLEKAAARARILLSLGQHQYGRTAMAIGSLFGRHGILLCGVLTCRQHFAHSEINDLAQHIFNRVDWQWLSEDTLILPHGWTPETGFLQYRWDNYSELMMMYLLGMGRPRIRCRRDLGRVEADDVRI